MIARFFISRLVMFAAFAAGLFALSLPGCENPPEQKGPTGLGEADGGGEAIGDGAVSIDANAHGATGETTPNEPARKGPSFAVVSSDWTATSVSILDAQGQVLADDYLTSGSARAGLVTALSGDVDLPKRSGESGTLVLLDRFKTDVITRIRLTDGAILGQVKTHSPTDQASQSSFSSNPHDYVYVDPQTAWVTRNEPNLDPSAPEIDRGNDLLRIDPSTMQRTSDRVDLSVLNALGTPSSAAAEVTLYARPSRMVRLGKMAVVGVARTAFDFKAIGPGAVALVDLETKAVTPLELEGLKGCSGVSAIPNDADSVLVSCAGDRNADPRDTAGLVHLRVANGAATVEHVFRATDDPSPKPLTSAVVALGGTLIAAAANDYQGQHPDVFAVVDLATGRKSELISVTPGSGRFGTPAFDVATGLLLVPDASVDASKRPTAGVRRFQRNADGSFTELAVTRVATSTAMPVRHVYLL